MMSSNDHSLPTAEEARNSEIFREASNSFTKADADVETAFSGSQTSSEHDQLPSVEDVRLDAGRGGGGGRGRWKLFLMAALVIVAAIAVAVVLAVTNTGTEDREFPIAHGSTESGSYNFETGTGPAQPVKPTTANTGSTETTPARTDAPQEETKEETTTIPPTQPVPSPPPDSRYGKLAHILWSEGISTMPALTDEDSPQHKAAVFISNEDQLALDLDSPDLPVLTQRYVMATMFYAVGGARWPNRLNFLNGDHECKWFLKAYAGDKKTIRQYGTICNDNNVVTGLHFPSNFLTGSFPPEMTYLTGLERFEAFNNPGLKNGFPTFFQGLGNIKYIGLHYCGLTGTLPDWLGDLKTLTSLVLSNNEFTGSLPANMGNLVSLENLYLDDNQLEGSIDMLGGLTSIQHLVMEDNQFEGSLTDAMVGSWSNLQALDVSHNKLTSTLPAGLFTNTNIRILDLHGNQFSGALPSFTVSDSKLEILTLNENQLTGDIPDSFGQLVNLKQLDVTGNQLSGNIPSTFGSLVNLELLYMAKNPFAEAGIPSFLQSLTKLQELSLKDTKRTGSIPDWMGQLTTLVLLDLDDNQLSGSIPDSIGNLVNLRYLLLNRNQLEGAVPSTLSALDKLAFFMIEQNNISGSADGVCGFPEVRQMFVADCRGDASDPQVACPCCNVCCADGDEYCNDQVWLGDSNPIWELGYVRQGPVEFDAAASRSYTVQFSGDIYKTPTNP